MTDPRFPYEAELAEARGLPPGTVAVRVCPDPVFVIGSPRSGTSILAWALSQHEDIATFAESDFIYHVFGEKRLDQAYDVFGHHVAGGWLAKHDVGREEFFAFLGLGLNALLSSRSSKRRWVDQSPTYTLVARRLAELFPGATFLHILRDGRQVVNSMVNCGFDEPWARDFRTACRTWVEFVRKAADFEFIWPRRCMTVPHAELVSAPEEWFDRVLEFIGAAPSALPGQYFKTHRINSSYDRGSMLGDTGRHVSTDIAWRGPADPSLDWTSEQRAIFAEEAGEVMLEYGFALEGELVC